MIKNIIDLLKVVDIETENIHIAKGKYKLAENFSEMVKQVKNKKNAQKSSN